MVLPSFSSAQLPVRLGGVRAIASAEPEAGCLHSIATREGRTLRGDLSRGAVITMLMTAHISEALADLQLGGRQPQQPDLVPPPTNCSCHNHICRSISSTRERSRTSAMSSFAANSSVATTSSAAFAALSAFLAEMEALDREAEQQEYEYAVASPCSSSTSSSDSSCDDGFLAALLATSSDDQAPRQPASRAAHSSSSSPSVPAAPPPKQRIRAKHTIDKLRADAEMLQNELEKLQMADKRRRLRSDSSPATVSAPPPSKKPRVQRVRDDVMEQNKYLRSLVAEQQKLSRQVGSVLRRMQSKQVRTSSRITCRSVQTLTLRSLCVLTADRLTASCARTSR